MSTITRSRPAVNKGRNDNEANSRGRGQKVANRNTSSINPRNRNINPGRNNSDRISLLDSSDMDRDTE